MNSRTPARRRIVVDGSNLATEGRTLPSLAQLNEAIETFLEEYQGFAAEDVTVVVDASFGHRIDPSEVSGFDDAIEHGEMVTPPAGAVGRGDGFILRIAEKSGALVLSNDSFQEFHAERPWLFEPGRLIGGKPVPGVGWVFTPRTPVRGPRSRSVTAKSKRDSKAADLGELDDELVDTGEEAVVDADAAPKAKRSRRRRGTRGTGSSAGAERAAGDGDDDEDAAAPVAVPSADTLDADDAYEGVGGRRARSTTATKKSTAATKAAKSTPAAKKTTTPEKKGTAAAKATKATTAARSSGATKSAKSAKATAVAKVATAKKAATRVGKATAGATTVTASDATGRAPRKRASATKTGNAAKTAATAATGTDEDTGAGRQRGEALNDAMTFITFVAEHPIGSSFEGEVVSFTSHGAHVDVAGMMCHVPLRNLGDPAPQKARSVLTKGERRTFELVSLDAPRRRAEIALPGRGA